MGITSYLVVEDEKACLKFCHPESDLIAMFRQQLAPGFLGRRALRAKPGITQHFLNRHTSRFEPAQELDPCEDRSVIDTLTRTVSQRERQQSDPFIVANRIGRETRLLGDITYLHGCVLVST